MKTSLRKCGKTVLAGVLVVTLVLHLFQGMGYVLASRASMEPETYTVTLKNAAQVFISNDKAPTEGPITLTYTVQEANKSSTQTGFIATTTPEADYPYTGGAGSLRFWSWNRLMTAGRTYQIALSLDSGNKIAYQVTQTQDGETKNWDYQYDTPDRMTGSANANATFYGIWLSEGSENAVLTNVSCVDAAGNDLGVKAKATTGSCTVVKNETEEPEGPTGPDTYTVTLENAAQVFISNDKAPTEGPITLTYTVQEANKSSTQTGFIATTTPEADYPYTGGAGSLRFWSWNRLMTAGRTYQIALSLDSGNKIAYQVTQTQDGETKNWDYQYDTPDRMTGSANANATFYGIWLSEGSENAVLTNVSCVDAAGNDLGVKAKATTGTCSIVKDDAEEPDEPIVPEPPIVPEERTYRELTFADWGIYDSITEGTMIYRPTDKTLTSLDGVAISGNVNFGGKNQRWLRIGGTSSVKQGGFWLGGFNGGLYLTPQGIGGSGDFFPLNQNEWNAIKNDDIALRMTFDKAEDSSSWTVGVHVNGELKGKYTMRDVQPGVYIGVTTGLKAEEIGPKAEGPIQQQTPEELGFKEITLNMFGLKKEATYKPRQIKGDMKYAVYALSSLDMTYLNADVTFQKAQDGDSIRYASADGWRGIMITAIKEGLKVENAETGEGVFYTLEQLGLSKMTEKFNLKLGVDMGNFSMGKNNRGQSEQQCDEIKLCIWINNKLIAKDVVLKNVIMAGKGIGIYTPKGGITLGTPSDAYTGVDFSLFGYTREWEKQIGLK